MDDPVGPDDDPTDPNRNQADVNSIPEDADFPGRPVVPSYTLNNDEIVFYEQSSSDGGWIRAEIDSDNVIDWEP